MAGVIRWQGVLTSEATAPAFLSAHTGLSRSAIRRAIAAGAVWIRDRRGRRVRLRRAGDPLPPGTAIWLFYDAQLIACEPPQAVLLHRQRDFSVWFKPPGLLTQGTDWGDHAALLRQAEKRLRRPVWLVHRLDRETMGIVVVAHRRQAAGWLSKQFQQRTVEKRYLAWVLGEMRGEGVFDRPLDGRVARTRYQAGELRRQPVVMTEVRLMPETGRLHQLRRHLAMAGYPVVGDPRYGRPQSPALPMQLAAVALRFVPPGERTARTFQVDRARLTANGFLQPETEAVD